MNLSSAINQPFGGLTIPKKVHAVIFIWPKSNLCGLAAEGEKVGFGLDQPLIVRRHHHRRCRKCAAAAVHRCVV